MQKGFTFLELILVVGIIGLITIVAVPFLGKSISKNELQASTWETVDSLRRAQGQAMASRSNSVWSVHFETTKVVVFQGATYTPTDPNNVEIVLPSIITISSISLAGGGNEVTFSKIFGSTSQNGTITLQNNNTLETKTVTITAVGQID